MKSFKRSIIILLILIGMGILFSNTSKVKAFNDGKEIIIDYSESIDAKKLEDIKAGAFNLLIKPQISLKANPTQEEVNRYYYNQLKHDISRNTYNVMKSELSDTVTISLNDSEYSIESATNNNISQCFRENLFPYIMDGFEAYVMDGEQNYWWIAGAQFEKITTEYKNGKIKFKSVDMKSKCQEWSDYQNFNTKLEEESKKISGNSVYEIARSINNYICKNVEYKELEDTVVEQTAYGALMRKVAVCEGQAKLFKLMCEKNGVMCINVYGYTNMNNTTTAHAWNYVYEPSNGQWYAVDVTWNNFYKDALYLMVGSETVVKDKKFGQNHIPGFKQFTNQTYTPSSPVLATDRYIVPISLDGNYIVNIQPNTKYEDFKKEFSSDLQFVVKENGNNITDTTTIKTGQIFVIGNNEYILVVTGDTTGDGKADINDILDVNKHRLKKVLLTDASLKAGDTNKDGIVNINDILDINKYRLNKITEL